MLRRYPANNQPLYEFQTRPRVGVASSAPWQFAVQQNQYSDYSVACLLAAEKAISNVLTENAGECVVLQLHAAAQDSIELHLSSKGSTTARNVVPAKADNASLTAIVPEAADAANLGKHDTTKWWDEEFVFEEPAAECARSDDTTESGATGAMNEHTKMVLDAVEKAAAAQPREFGNGQNHAPVHYASSQRGAWDFVVGLVGKPSAGKSTFFNAASRCVRVCNFDAFTCPTATLTCISSMFAWREGRGQKTWKQKWERFHLPPLHQTLEERCSVPQTLPYMLCVRTWIRLPKVAQPLSP